MSDIARLAREHDTAIHKAQRDRGGAVFTTSAYGEGKPLVSVAMGVHPEQSAERNAMLKRLGIKCAHYDMKTGKLHITSRKARNQVLAMHDYIDKDAGYGDRS